MNSTFQTVIRTKILPPVNRTALVNRERLIDQIISDKKTKLTLIAAPAGFGKTTLIGQLFEKMSVDISCCWYSLDQSDNDPTRFLLHFISAIRIVHDSFGEKILRLMETTLIADISDTLAHLINDLVDIDKDLCLYIDDFHFSDSEHINQFIELLINLSPENFRLIISSRLRPNLSLSGLKVHGHLNEITASHLRFDDQEAETFMNEIHELDLSTQQLTNLHNHSEGWIAGLQLASLSLRDMERRNEFIDSFSGNLRDIAEYLATDVLNQQNQEIRDFLLRTSILERMNADVCSALTGIENCQSFLENLEEQNLFVIPLDRERLWYRYHHLFHEFLLGQLRKRFPSEIVNLHQNAAEWFESAGLASEAVDYALLSGDMSKAVELVESQVEDEMKAGRMTRVNNWVNRIPNTVCESHPKLLFAKCTSLYHMNKPDEAEVVLKSLKKNSDLIDSNLKDQIGIIEAGIAISRDDIDQILAPLSDIGLLPSDFDNGTVNNIRGYAQSEMGNYEQALQSLNDARHFHKLNGSSFGVVYADCFLAFIDLASGNLQKCFDRFTDYENVDGVGGLTDMYVAPVPSILQGIIQYEWNDLENSFELLMPSLPIIEKVGHNKLLSLGYMTLAKIYGSRNDHISAKRFFNRIYTLGESRGIPYLRLKSLVESERIRYLISNKQINEAIDISLSMGIDIDIDSPILPDDWERITCLKLLIWSRLQIATGMAKRSLPVLSHLEKLADKVGRYKRVIECRILQAIANMKIGKQDVAEKFLFDSLTLSYPNHIIRAYIDEDNLLLKLLKIVIKRSDIVENETLLNYIQLILAAGTQENPIEDQESHESMPSSLIEPLSEREIDILELIAAGQSNHIIAEKLSISENTVKWHLKNIFGKLSVNKRAAAVVTAQQLKLLK